MLTAEQIIDHYQLESLDQEGGFFRQIFCSPIRIKNDALVGAKSVEGDHPIGTVIQFLLTVDSFSAMHRLPTAEHWFHHQGDACEILLLHENGSQEVQRLGPDIAQGDLVYAMTPPNAWQGTRVADGGKHGYMFGSCVMIPGFEWSDFELGDRLDLEVRYPMALDAIRLRTRDVTIKGAL